MRFQTFTDLLKRYGTAFKTAWQQRADMESPQRLPYEAQFLPAALALQETPVSPAPRIAIWLLISFAAIAMVWAYFGHIDVVATAHGKIVPNTRTKTIQPFETATVKAIQVTDGQTVKAGDVLIELDATSAHADQKRIIGDRAVAQLLIARGQALLTAIKSGKAPKLQSPIDSNNAMFQEAEHLLLAQYSEYTTKLNQIDAEIAKREAELRSTQELVRKLEQTLPIAEQRAEDFRGLVGKHFVSQHDYLEHEQARIEQEADLAYQRSRLKEIAAALREAHGQRVTLTAETRRISLDSMTDDNKKSPCWSRNYSKPSHGVI